MLILLPDLWLKKRPFMNSKNIYYLSAHNIKRAFRLLLGLLVTTSFFFSILSWQEIRRAEEQHLSALAELAGRSADTFFRHLQGSMGLLKMELGDAAKIIHSEADVTAILQRFKNANPDLLNIILVRPDGQLIASANHDSTQPMPSVADERSFQLGLTAFNNGEWSDVGQPMLGRLNQKWVIPIRYAIRDDNGKLILILAAVLPLSTQQAAWQDLGLPGNSVMGLIRDDAYLVSRFPIPDIKDYPKIYGKPRTGVLVKTLNELNFPAKGITQGRNSVNDSYQVFSYHRLSHQPLTLFISYPITFFITKWWESTRLPFFLILLLGFSGVLVYRRVIQQQIDWESERNQSEHVLRQSQIRLAEALKIARVAYWEFDCLSEKFVLSDQFIALLRSDASHDRELSIESFVSLYLSPEDGKRIVEDIRHASTSSDPEFEFSHAVQMHCGDGLLRWFQLQLRVQKDAHGQTVKLSGTIQDVDARKIAESSLRLMAQVFQHSGEAILLCDAQNSIVATNAAFTELTGYEQEEVLGKNPKLLSAGKSTDEEYHLMWESIQNRGFWRGEIWDRRKSGELYPKWLSITAVRNEQGQVTNYVGSFSDITEFKTAEERVYHLAHHDSLTNLPNRFTLQTRLEQAVAAAQRNQEKVAVMFIDLDHFKTINDTLGHHVGDKLLIEVASRLQLCVRSCDIVARLGGDEFVVALAGVQHLTDASHVAEKIQVSLSLPSLVDNQELYTTPSIGISLFPDDAENVEALMKNADMAMYHAKSLGRNNYQFFTAAMNQVAMERRDLEISLRGAVEREEFILHYQPQIDAHSGQVVGVEALVRWQHPELGLVAPSRFIPLAEETGLILPLGEWVLRAACLQLRQWHDEGIQGFTLSVNLCALQFQQRGLLAMAGLALSNAGLKGEHLELEITESVAMANPLESIEIMKALNEMGVSLAIDDFGTGYSSLTYLKLFPIKRLKLDRSFIKDIETDPSDAAICAATIVMAHSLGLDVVAEGVETRQQYEYLQRLDCDKIQGFYFCKPLPPQEIGAFITQRTKLLS